MMLTFKEYAFRRDQVTVGNLNQPIYHVPQTGMLATAAKRYGKSWQQAVAQNPQQFVQRNVLNPERLKTSIEAGLEPYMSQTTTATQLNQVSNNMKQVIGNVKNVLLNRFRKR